MKKADIIKEIEPLRKELEELREKYRDNEWEIDEDWYEEQLRRIHQQLYPLLAKLEGYNLAKEKFKEFEKWYWKEISVDIDEWDEKAKELELK